MFKNNFSHESGVRVNKIISDYNPAGLTKLRGRVESFLGDLRTQNGGTFSYMYPITQHVRCLSFNITQGLITSAEMEQITKEFPGSQTMTGPNKSGSVLLVPKSLAAYEESDDEDSDSGSSASRRNNNLRLKKAKFICELIVYLVVLIVIVVFVLMFLAKALHLQDVFTVLKRWVNVK